MPAHIVTPQEPPSPSPAPSGPWAATWSNWPAYQGLRVIAGAAPFDHDLLRELGAMPVAKTADAYLEAVPEGVDALVGAAATGTALLPVIRQDGDHVQCRPGPLDLPPDMTPWQPRAP